MSVRLKESCSACAASKLKCSKDKPTCKRCARRRSKCEYEPSNRRGRIHTLGLVHATAPSSTDPNAFRASSTESIDSGISLGLSELQAGLTNGFAEPSAGSSQQATTLHTTTTFPGQSDWDWPLVSPYVSPPPAVYSAGFAPCQTPQWTQITPASLQSPVINDSPVCTTPMPGLMPQHMKGQNPYMEHQVPYFVPNDSLPPAITSNNIDPIPVAAMSTARPDEQLDQEHACFNVVVETLEQVSANENRACARRPFDQTSEQTQLQSPSLKEVVKVNKQTIETLAPMLECHCLQDEFVIMLLPLVVMKTIASYSAAARRSWANDGSAGPRSPCLEDGFQYTQHQADYNQRRVAASLVLSGLHRVQRLVKFLSIRIHSLRSQRPAGDPSAAVLSAETLEQLEVDMRARVQTASREIIEMLRSE